MASQVKAPGTVTGTNWSGTGNVTLDDNSYAQYTNTDIDNGLMTEVLDCRDFGFTVFDPIVSVTLSVKRKRSSRPAGDPVVEDSEIYLLDAGTQSGSNLAVSGDWGTSESFQNYDLGSLTAAQINDPDFGATISAFLVNAWLDDPNPNIDTVAYIEQVLITVVYVGGGPGGGGTGAGTNRSLLVGQ